MERFCPGMLLAAFPGNTFSSNPAGFDIKMLGLVTDSKRNILLSLSDTKPNRAMSKFNFNFCYDNLWKEAHSGNLLMVLNALQSRVKHSCQVSGLVG